MRRLVSIRIGWALALFAVLDLACVGLGMGVPIFCIPFGLPVGWYIAMRFAAPPVEMKRVLGRMLAGAALTSGFTLVVMAAIWGRAIGMLFDPAADLANFGIPLILYDPTASFAGWLALMIVVSPFLQFLVTLLGSHVTALWRLSRAKAKGDGETR